MGKAYCWPFKQKFAAERSHAVVLLSASVGSSPADAAAEPGATARSISHEAGGTCRRHLSSATVWACKRHLSCEGKLPLGSSQQDCQLL